MSITNRFMALLTPTTAKSSTMKRPLAGLFILLFMLLSSSSWAVELTTELKLPPAQVKGPDACGECHKESVKVWQKTHHAKTFKELPRMDEAKKIAKNMGIKRIKSGSDCLGCHFTSALKIVNEKEKVKPIAGITCESCHGAGKDWIDIHSDFGGKDVKAENEAPEHKKERWANAEAAGMIRPLNLYALAKNCYGCHTVPNEKLVNVGGHTAGSKFNLVSWSQGEVRHNIWYTEENQGADLNRKRMMYAVGASVDLEMAFRGLAKATTKADYALAMAKRAKRALKLLTKISTSTGSEEIAAILALGKSTKLKLNNEAAYIVIADKLANLTQAFVQNNDGSNLSAIDAMLPSAETYKGSVWQP